MGPQKCVDRKYGSLSMAPTREAMPAVAVNRAVRRQCCVTHARAANKARKGGTSGYLPRPKKILRNRGHRAPWPWRRAMMCTRSSKSATDWSAKWLWRSTMRRTPCSAFRKRSRLLCSAAVCLMRTSRHGRSYLMILARHLRLLASPLFFP